MSVIDTLVYDRTEEDVLRWKTLRAKSFSNMTSDEKTEWLSDLKGTYNYTDLNRVTAAIEYLDEKLKSYGYETGVVPVEIDHGGGRLPAGYTELAYIQSSGTQYVDTGVMANNNTRVVLDAAFPVAPPITVGMFGGRTSATSKNYAMLRTSSAFRSDYNNVYTQTWAVTPTARRIFDKNKETTTIDGVSQSYTNETFQCDYTLYLFGINNAGSTSFLSSLRLYSCRIYDNNTLVRNYVPCTNTVGEVGLYDLVSASFFGNAGTGTFIAGPKEELDPYTWYETDIQRLDQLNQYLANVAAIRSVLAVYATTPEIPTDIEALTYGEANDIEKILVDVEDVIRHMVDAMRRLNAPGFYSGAEPLPSASSDLGRTWAELDAMQTTWANWNAASWYLLLHGNLEATA